MKRLSSPPSTVRTLVTQIAAAYRPLKMVLFGSYAWGKPGPGSDIDLLIIKDTTTKRTRRREEALAGVERTTPVTALIFTPEEIDFLLEQKAPLVTEIMERGTVVYGVN